MSDTNPFTQLPSADLVILNDTFDVIRDRLNHYPDGEMGWEEDQVGEFHALNTLLREACKVAGFWWAK